MHFQNPFLTQDLVQAVLNQLAVDLNSIHGLAHWIRVERNGLFLAQASGVDVNVISCFALFHDACRLSDGSDFGHGARGAKLARHFFENGRLSLLEKQTEQLCQACEGHTDGQTHADPLIGACWDSDRLDLPRVGIVPSTRFMSTQKGKELVGAESLDQLSGYVHSF